MEEKTKKGVKRTLILAAGVIFVCILLSFLINKEGPEAPKNETIPEIEEQIIEENQDTVTIVTTNESETFINSKNETVMECEYLNGSAHQNCTMLQ